MTYNKTIKALSLLALFSVNASNANGYPQALYGDYGVYSNLSFDTQANIVPNPQRTIKEGVNSYITEQLSPQDVERLKKVYENRDRVLSAEYSKMPIPVKKSIVVDMSPQAPLQVIRVAKGMQTTIAFVDEAGEAWDIESVSINTNIFNNYSDFGSGNNGYDNGFGGLGANANALTSSNVSNITPNTGIGFSADANGNGLQAYNNGGGASFVSGGGNGNNALNSTGSSANGQDIVSNKSYFGNYSNTEVGQFFSRSKNIISFEPKQLYGSSNMTIKLRGKVTPVVFLLHIGQAEVDALVTAYVNGENPSGTYAPFNGRSNRGSTTLDTNIDNNTLAFLDGRIPQGAKELMSSDGTVQAWEFGNKLYLKTRYDILTPRYTSKASLNGYSVFRFENPSKVKQIVMLQKQGNPVTVELNITPYYMR